MFLPVSRYIFMKFLDILMNENIIKMENKKERWGYGNGGDCNESGAAENFSVSSCS